MAASAGQVGRAAFPGQPGGPGTGSTTASLSGVISAGSPRRRGVGGRFPAGSAGAERYAKIFARFVADAPSLTVRSST
jgi:hypothetical protein